MSDAHDIAVVGAGPAGSLAAIALAGEGARVLLLDGNPGACSRFAGEWVHPPGLEVLDRLQVGRLDGTCARTGYGFVVLPDDAGDAIELPYPSGKVALACEHSELVRTLRQRAVETRGVDYLPYARVTALETGTLWISERGRMTQRMVRAELIVGADGRSSIVRRHLSRPGAIPISYMASLELVGVELPREGFGHVLVGGPGPVLMYRIDSDRVRACLDVPLSLGPAARRPEFLWEGFRSVIPAALRQAFRRALERGPVRWASTQFMPRGEHARDDIALIGDAAGHTHPLTAVGITQGFADAEALARSQSLDEYHSRRSEQSYGAELLSNALYHVMHRDDVHATAIRHAVYRTWREDEKERRRTMRILMGGGGRADFGRSFGRIASSALGTTLARELKAGRLRALPHTLGSYREWLGWPLASAAPARLRARYRIHTSTRDPIPPLSTLLRTELGGEGGMTIAEAPQLDIAAVEGEVQQALAAAVEALHGSLADLGPVFGSLPDVALARIATPMLHAVQTATQNPSMVQRMRLGRRRLATQGVETYLQDHAQQTDPSQCQELSGMLLALFDVEPWHDEGIVQLDRGLDALLACQTREGGFARNPHGRSTADIGCTEMACRALNAASRHCDGARSDRIRSALTSARQWLRATQSEQGAWPGEHAVRDTGRAMQALIATGVGPIDPALRRAARWLAARQARDGWWGERTASAGDPQSIHRATASALCALTAADAPYRAQMALAARRLSSVMTSDFLVGTGDSARLAVAATEPSPLRSACCEVAVALARYRKRRPFDSRYTSTSTGAVTGTTRRARATGATSDPPIAGAPTDDWTFCKESLLAVSRTFSQPIAVLSPSLQRAVTVAYLLCRMADTIEDFPSLDVQLRDKLFTYLTQVLQGDRHPGTLAAAFSELDSTDADVMLGRNLPRIMRVYSSLPTPTRRTCTRWIAEMVRGMNLYAHRERGDDGIVALNTVEDLDRYCYYAAGTVGVLLTELFHGAMDGALSPRHAALMRRNAEAFGVGLQMVNILKDITDDRAHGRSFVPTSLCEAHGLVTADLVKPAYRSRAHAVVEPLFERARGYLDQALQYTLAVPPEQHGIRLFCLLPLWMAASTLVHAKDNDAMFDSERPVKISRQEVQQIVTECTRLLSDDRGLRAAYEARWTAPRRRLSGIQRGA